jgi:hypothetical protein
MTEQFLTVVLQFLMMERLKMPAILLAYTEPIEKRLVSGRRLVEAYENARPEHISVGRACFWHITKT